MDIKLASPLFIVRNEAQNDLFGVLEKLNVIGFDGVEFLGFFNKEPKDIRNKLDSLSMKALGNHVDFMDFLKNPVKVIEDHIVLGCKYLTISWLSRDVKPGTAEFDKAISNMMQMATKCRDNGITPLYHNHDFEFETDPSMLDIIIDSCKDSGLCLEPDLGWMAFKQIDPRYYLQKYVDCCPVIHLKDIYARDISMAGSGMELGTKKAIPEKGYFEFRPTGYGMLNIPELMPLCMLCDPEWMVMDHDMAYERDSFNDLKLSLEYTRNLLKMNR